jgi:hypothetical protein
MKISTNRKISLEKKLFYVGIFVALALSFFLYKGFHPLVGAFSVFQMIQIGKSYSLCS